MAKHPGNKGAGKTPRGNVKGDAARGPRDGRQDRAPKGGERGKNDRAGNSVRPREEQQRRSGQALRKPDRDNLAKQPSPKISADLFGLHAVREAWFNPDRFVHALYATENALKELEAAGKPEAKRPAPIIVTKEQLDRALPPGTVHQGVALSCQPLAELSVIDVIIAAEGKAKSVIVVLDQVTDPHNVGAILRSACAFGADGVVMQSRHAPEGTGILAKTACGALEHIRIAYETNLSRAIEKLKEHHYTVIGLDEHAEKTFGELYSYDRAVIVLGAEGSGMRRLIKEHCDVLVTLPTRPPIASLNVSNAAAVALYALTA